MRKLIATLFAAICLITAFGQVDSLKNASLIGQASRNQKVGHGFQIGFVGSSDDTCQINTKLQIVPNAGAGKVLTSDANGFAYWTNSSSIDTFSGTPVFPSGIITDTVFTTGGATGQVLILINDTTGVFANAPFVDTIYRNTGIDSIYFSISGRLHAIKDSAGAGGTSLNLYHENYTTGTVSSATGDNAVAIGAGNAGIGVPNPPIATGANSFAIGISDTASGIGSFVGGANSKASNIGSFAFGSGAVSSGNLSVAFGLNSIASGSGSIAFFRGVSTGQASFAIGGDTAATAGAGGAFAYGTGAIATGSHSTARGIRTIARSANEFVVGTYNTDYTPANNNSDRLFVVGNGTNESSRSNAIVLLKDGKLGIATSTPQALLHNTGTSYLDDSVVITAPVNITDGTQGTGKVLTSDANGNATWSGSDGLFVVDSVATTGDTTDLATNTYTAIIASGAITDLVLRFPSSPSNGDVVVAKFDFAVTTLTSDGQGATIYGFPSSTALGQHREWRYNSTTGAWY